MARGRKKKSVKPEVVKKETSTEISLPLIEDIIDHKDDFVNILPVSAPVISSAEYKGEPDPEPQLDYNNYTRKLPKPQVITQVIKPKKKEEVKIEENKKKPEVIKVVDDTDTDKKTDNAEDSVPLYPPKISELMIQLRQNPAYRYLPNQTLIKIISSKLRSKYFFNNVKRSGGVNPNFTIK